ncbi:MAG: hypothetical protein ACXVEF_43545 [Polyangiales bacterium]
MRIAFVFAFLAGCSGSSDSAPTAQAADAMADALAETSPACGTAVGDTLCDLDLQGYVRDATDGLASTATPGGPFKLSTALAAGKQRYAFVFNTAYW